jgi:exodeoxyribonuclease VII small subunit
MSEEEPLSFEEAMSRLERIVTELEAGTPTLEVALARFEEGIALGKVCRAMLERADLRVRTLLESADGSRDEGGAPDAP